MLVIITMKFYIYLPHIMSWEKDYKSYVTLLIMNILKKNLFIL